MATGDATTGGDGTPGADALTGCTFVSDVLVNGGFETPLCTPPTITGWMVTESAGWLDETGRPAISDAGGCGTTGYGCPDWLHADAVGVGCFSEFGDFNSTVGSMFTLHQLVLAPMPVHGLRLRYARATGQIAAGWAFEVRITVGTTESPAIDPISSADVEGVFDTGVLVATTPAPDVNVSLVMSRTGTSNGYGWLWVDDMHLDLCY